MTDYNKIINRANIQEMRALFLQGLDGLEPEEFISFGIVNYEERIREREQPLMTFIENLYPDGIVRDAVFELVCNAILVNQEVYTEIGMRLGAQAVFELLKCDQVKEFCHGEDN